MSTPTQNLYFAARRTVDQQGSPEIVLVSLEYGNRTPFLEKELLAQCGCRLGDFILVTDTIGKTSFRTTTVEGDVAFIDDVDGKLVKKDNHLFFQCESFGNVYSDQWLLTGHYKVRISLLPEPKTLLSGETFQFQAHVPKLVKGDRPSPVSFTSGPRRESSASPATGNSVEGGAPKHMKPVNNRSSPVVAGGGFPVKKPANQKREVIQGAGFAVENQKKDGNVIVGAGFANEVPKAVKLRAVVLTVNENQKTKMFTYYLWILDKKAEGRFVTKDYKLAMGHFFQGDFAENKDNRWNCIKYLKPIDQIVQGGITDSKIWFKVKVEKFQAAGGNRRFGVAQAHYFGEVLEGELESQKMSMEYNGKYVKIQRKGIAEKEYAWIVMEKF